MKKIIASSIVVFLLCFNYATVIQLLAASPEDGMQHNVSQSQYSDAAPSKYQYLAHLSPEEQASRTMNKSFYGNANNQVQSGNGIVVASASVGNAADNNSTPFITTWQTTTANETIGFNTIGDQNAIDNTGGLITSFPDYNFTVDWGDGTSNTYTGDDPDPRHDYATANTYTVQITGELPAFTLADENFTTTPEKLLTVEQWGDIVWYSAAGMFFNALNMTYNASDIPNLTNVQFMDKMFEGASSFNGDIGDWDVSSVISMRDMFLGATLFNQDLNNWDVSNVVDMKGMFYGGFSSSGPEPTNSFNRDISAWDVSNVTDMNSMFANSAFNQDISTKTVNSGTADEYVAWNVSSVKDMEQMFALTPFNQDIGNWNVSSVENMSFMFALTPFNQDIGSWDVAAVTNMAGLFFQNTGFDQNIGSWDVSGVQPLDGGPNLLSINGTLSTANYDALLEGWSQLTLQNGLTLDVGDVAYCATDARQSIIDTYSWTINDGGESTDCTEDFTPFITTWAVSSDDLSLMIPTGGGADITDFDFTIDWGDGTTETITGDDPDPSHTYATAGTYTVSIRGVFPHMFVAATPPWISDSVDEINIVKLQTVQQWGDIQWESMDSMFEDAENMTYNATDAPDLSLVTTMNDLFREAHNFNGDLSNWDVTTITNMTRTFRRALSFNGNISTWNVGNVTIMDAMFRDAEVFNQPLNDWIVSNVTDMNRMFQNADAFNQDLDDWDVSNVTDFSAMFKNTTLFDPTPDFYAFNGNISGWVPSAGTDFTEMFAGATAFNQDIGGWDVSSATDMGGMFEYTPFNQPLGQWDVSNVTNMSTMFANATAFDQDLGSWDVSAVTDFVGFMTGSGLSTANYDALLEGWSQLTLQNGLTLDVGDVAYCATDARQSIIDTYSWTINDGGQSTDCAEDFAPFVTTWAVTSDDLTLMIPTGGGEDITDFDFTIDWGDGTTETITGDDPDPTHTYTNSGVYTVTISGVFPHMFVNVSNSWEPNTLDETYIDKLESIEQWGDIAWESMESMFQDADNMTYNATDVPDLSLVTSLQNMFYNVRTFNSDISNWDVSNVTDMTQMFRSDTSFSNNVKHEFNQDISNWNVSNVTDMDGMFFNSNFNQPVNNWDVSNVTEMRSMFGYSNFNQPLDNWDVSGVTNMSSLFASNAVFNQDISNWNTSSVTEMSGMFSSADAFTQDISTKTINAGTVDEYVAWDVSNVTDMRRMFLGNQVFNQDISNWNVSNVTRMDDMFERTKVFNQDIGGWDVSSVTEMDDMFRNSEAFNQDISGWDVSSVTVMDDMFENAQAFSQDLNGWDVSAVTTMQDMFHDAAVFNGNISDWNVSGVTDMDDMFEGATAFNQNINTKVINEGTPEEYMAWDVSNVTDMADMFQDASSFNQDISRWNVSIVTDMDDMFKNATAFDQDLGSWDVSAVTDFVGFMTGSGLSTANYDALLEGWSQLTLQNGLTLDVGDVAYCATDARQSIIDTYSWTINDGGESTDCTEDFTPFITTWAVSSDDLSLMIPTGGGADITDFDFTIDWGDGTTETITGDDPDPSHTYATAGTYTVSIRGVFPWMQHEFSDAANAVKLQTVEQWGDIQWESMEEMFNNAENMTFNNVTDAPNLTQVTNMSDMFENASSFNGDISNWDVSTVQDFSVMFKGALAFNQNLSSWDVSSATSMASMFFEALSFDQPIGNWDVSNVTTFENMFRGPGDPDGPQMSFSQDISNWNTISAETMSSMFERNRTFNQNIGDWNVSNVEDFNEMFRDASAFNQDIGGWNVSSAIDIREMFRDATAFNQDVSTKTINAGETDEYVAWDVSSVTNMINMFRGATAFNQDLSSWNVSSVSAENAFGPFLAGSGLSTENYDALLIGWSQLDLASDTFLGVGSINYSCAAADARQSIIDTYGWTIDDGGSEVDCDFTPFVTTWATTSANESITIPTGGGADITDFDFTIEWGDGTTETITGDDPDPTHTYATAGTYTVSIRGVFPWMQHEFSDAANAVKLQTVEQWGDIQWEKTAEMFYQAENMTFNNVTDAPNLTQVTNMGGMFADASSFNGDISNWDVSTIQDFSAMFKDALAFNQNLSSWDVSSATSMASMFFEALSFDQPIGNWDVSNVTTFENMFRGPGDPDGPQMSFSQDISNWNTISAETMSSMFERNRTFNQNIGDWNVSNVENFYEMFRDASAFNQDVSTKTINAGETDEYVAWDVSSATDMRNMFRDAPTFDQDISQWNVSNVGSFGLGRFVLSLSTENYDALLQAWSQLELTNGLSPNFGETTYSCASADARQSIIDTYGWTIDDGGLADDNEAPTVVTQDITVELDENGQASITADQIDAGSSDNCGVESLVLDITDFTSTDVGENTVTLTVTDASGNEATGTATVTVEDNIAPTLVTQDITVELDENGQASITAEQIDAGSTDNTGIESLAIDVTEFDCSAIGENEVTLTVTDTSGNEATGTATVTIEDNTVPTVLTQDITVELDANGEASITADQIDAGSSDNCGVESLVLDITDFTSADVGENTVTLTVTDANGNVSTETAIVTIGDDIAPTVLTQDITVELDENGQASITAEQIDAGSTDNTGIESLAIDVTEFDCSMLGENTVTLTVTDTSGNEATGTATVTVEDNTVPTVLTQDITVELDENGQASITADQIDAGSSDNCGVDTLTLDVSSFDCNSLGDNTVTLTVTDVNGDEATGTATVTVEDPNSSCENLGINNNTALEFTLYPNPVRNLLYIEGVAQSAIKSVSIYNIQGQLVNEFEELSGPIHCAHLEQGVYIVKIVSESNALFTERFVKY